MKLKFEATSSPATGDSHQDWSGGQRSLPAVILIALGGVFLLSNLHILRVTDVWAYWPVALLIAGAFKLADSASLQGRTLGAILLVVGAVVLASNLELIPINSDDLWPLALIAAGVYLLINRSANPWRRRNFLTSDAPGESAFFGGGKRKFITKDFKFAKFDAVFGGFEIDLREADMAGDPATIEVNAAFGGAEIRIPQNWSAVLHGTCLCGGFSDDSTQPNPVLTPNIKRLYCNGSAVFGGVNVKN